MLCRLQICNAFVTRFAVPLILDFDHGRLVGHIAFAGWAGLWVILVAPIPSLAKRICVVSEHSAFSCLQGSLEHHSIHHLQQISSLTVVVAKEI